MYTPDNWVIVKIKAPEKETLYKVLAGWYGGYTQGDSWKLSSGITEIIDKETYWELPQQSASVYKCYRNAERLSSYTASIFDQYGKLFKEKFGDQGVYEIIPIEQLIAEYDNNKT